MPKVIINNVETIINNDLKNEYEVISNNDKNEELILKSLSGEILKFVFFENQVWHKGVSYYFNKNTRQALNKAQEGDLLSPMPGKIIKVLVKENQEVKKGDTLLILEAMKMEHVFKAPKDGKIVELLFKEGDLVDSDIELIKLS